MTFSKLLPKACLLGLLGLSACSHGPDLSDRSFNNITGTDIKSTLPRNEVAQVIASGFYNVSERALTPVSVRELGLEGLRGLATIDPEITVRETYGDIDVHYAGEYVKTIIEPLEHDSESWADAVYDVLSVLWERSYDLRATNPERVYEAIFDASLANLDIFSRYAGQKEAQANRDRREGFGGVNLTLQKIDERFLISRVDHEGAAYESGVRKGDMIISIDDEPVIGKSKTAVQSLLRGKLQSEFTMTVERPDTGVTQKLYLWRDLVIKQTVWSSYDDGVMRLKVSGFNERTVSAIRQDVQDLALMHGDRFQGIVMDLRGNPGGLLRRAIQVADLFLAGGRIISTRGRHPDSVEYYEADGRDVAKGRHMVVLLDGRSASASEIVAAALQDRKRAVVVGSSSYGKGTVQSVQRLPNDGEITVTWSRLIAPSGYAFHGLGVRPSICTSGARDHENRGPALWEDDGYSLMNQWRKVAVDDRETRKSLRSTCPPDRNKKGIDYEIARNLILDPSLYQRFTGSTTIATVAQ